MTEKVDLLRYVCHELKEYVDAHLQRDMDSCTDANTTFNYVQTTIDDYSRRIKVAYGNEDFVEAIRLMRHASTIVLRHHTFQRDVAVSCYFAGLIDKYGLEVEDEECR